MRKEALIFRRVGDKAFDGASNLIVKVPSVWNAAGRPSRHSKPYHQKKPTDHRILAHEDYTFSSQTLSDLVHLLGADIVDGNNEYGLELLK